MKREDEMRLNYAKFLPKASNLPPTLLRRKKASPVQGTKQTHQDSPCNARTASSPNYAPSYPGFAAVGAAAPVVAGAPQQSMAGPPPRHGAPEARPATRTAAAGQGGRRALRWS